MRKEVKIAIFSIVTLGLAIWGYKFLKGFDILSKSTSIYSTYERVDGLRNSTPVLVNGFQVGLVANFFQKEGDLKQITVEMELNPGIKIPKNAVAEIVSTSIMGGNAINLVFTGNCEGETCLQDGDYIPGVTKGMLASLVAPDEVKVYMEELNKGLKQIVDSLSYKLSQSEDLNRSVEDVRVILTNLRSTTDKLDHVMASNAGTIEKSLKNIESITANLKESNQQIRTILGNAETFSGNLKDADIKGLVGTSKETMMKLQATLANSEKAIADLGIVMNNLKSGDGALPMLINDKAFADNLQTTVKNVDLLLRDLRLHPERYRRILSKKKMEYEYEPLEEDPGFQK